MCSNLFELAKRHLGFVNLLACAILIVPPAAAEPESGEEIEPFWEVERVAPMVVAPSALAVTPEGRIIVSLHPFAEPRLRVVELTEEGELAPFPSAEWNDPDQPHPFKLDSVSAVQSDAEGVVWMVDAGLRSGQMPKLVGWDTAEGRLHRLIFLPEPVTVEASCLSTLVLDEAHGVAYIADPADGVDAALIVVDLRSGQARRVLEGEDVLTAEPTDLVLDEQLFPLSRLSRAGDLAHLGTFPMALDTEAEWLYFGPMHGRKLYRVEAAELRNFDGGTGDLVERIEFFASMPVATALFWDSEGTLFLADPVASGVGTFDAEGNYRVLVADRRLLGWPADFALGEDGGILAVASQLHRLPVFHNGIDRRELPFWILKLTPPEP